MELNRREDDNSIITLTMAVERLADSQSQMSLAQAQMATEIKDLAKTIGKLDVVMEKMINIEDRHTITSNTTNERLRVLEKAQETGCPALREMKIGYEGKFEKLMQAIGSNKEAITELEKFVYKISWSVAGLVASVLGTAILMLVVNK